jgi:hypothetical protein
MTAINSLFILAISAMAAAGFWGMGRIWVKADTSAHAEVKVVPPKEAVALYPESSLRNPTAAGGNAQKYITKEFVKNEFDKIPKDERIDFETFWDDTKSLVLLQTEAIAKTEANAKFKESLGKPETLFAVLILSADELRDFIKPRPAEAFYVGKVGSEIDFVWVAEDAAQAGKGFWFSTKELASEPPKELELPEGIKLAVRKPTAEQWLAARKNQPADAIENLDGGKGEYLADGRVIGQSDIARDNFFHSPHRIKERIDIRAELERKAQDNNAISAEEKVAAMGALGYAKSVQVTPEVAKDISDYVKRKRTADAAKDRVKEEFAYRIVIEP